MASFSEIPKKILEVSPIKKLIVVLLTVGVLAFGASAHAISFDHEIKPTSLPTSH